MYMQQMLDGTWRKGEPIFSLNDYSPAGTSTKRDIGNSYVFFLDMIGSLVDTLTPLQSTLLEPYIMNLERCITWTENNVLEEMMPEECDPITKRCFGAIIHGWRSNHLGIYIFMFFIFIYLSFYLSIYLLSFYNFIIILYIYVFF
jgi:hypothetical protein